jgi:Flp pilus assembly protein TadG
MLLVTICFIAPLGFLAVEVSRFYLCRQEVQSCVEAAALAAACANASANSTDIATTHAQAQQFAQSMLYLNSMLAAPLTSSNVTVGSSTSQLASANQLMVNFQWMNTQGQNVSISDPTGKVLQVFGSWGYVPAFSTLLGGPIAGVYQCTAAATSGLPQLDVILCFDVSSSMDDYTMVAFIDRYNNGGKAGYALQAYNGHQASDTTVADNGFGHLYDTVWCTYQLGTSFNGSYPQSCDAGGSGNVEGVYTFDQNNRLAQGQPQTNSKSTSQPPHFTDMVVAPDPNPGNTDPSQLASGTWGNPPQAWPSGTAQLNCALEAARGNLESTTIATNAQVDLAACGNITPGAGWLKAYQTMASDFNHVQPIGNAMQAAGNFFTIMNNDCDSHFGFIAFGSGAGTTPTQTTAINPSLVANNFAPSPIGSQTFSAPYPGIKLTPTFGSTNYTQCEQAVGQQGGVPLVADGGTDTATALNQAVTWLNDASQYRKGARKAIVLFTDGLPNGAGDSFNNGSENWSNCQAAAKLAAKSNPSIPIYTIGLCQPEGTGVTPTLQSIQQQVLTDQIGSNGIAALGGTGGQFFQVTSPSAAQLNIAFENVARSLVQLVQTP